MSAAEAWIHSYYPSPFAGITQIRYWRSVTRPVTLSARFAPAPDTARIEHVRMEVNEMELSRIPHLRHSGGELAPYSDTGPESIPGEVHRHNIGGSPSCCPSELGVGFRTMGERTWTFRERTPTLQVPLPYTKRASCRTNGGTLSILAWTRTQVLCPAIRTNRTRKCSRRGGLPTCASGGRLRSRG